MGVVTSWRGGSRIANRAELFEVLSEILQSPTPLPPEAFSVALHLTASLILVSQGLQAYRELSVNVVKGVACCGRRGGGKGEVEMVLEFFQEISKDAEIFVGVSLFITVKS